MVKHTTRLPRPPHLANHHQAPPRKLCGARSEGRDITGVTSRACITDAWLAVLTSTLLAFPPPERSRVAEC